LQTANFEGLPEEKAHLVTGKAQKVAAWPDLDAETVEKARRKINTGRTIHPE
jgi:hypothetical protein